MLVFTSNFELFGVEKSEFLLAASIRIYELSSTENSLLFLGMLYPEDSTYCIPTRTVRLPGLSLFLSSSFL